MPLPPSMQSTLGTTFTVFMPDTMMEPSMRKKVSTALLNMAQAEPPVTFAGRYHLLVDQRHGGQAVVQFARDMRGSLRQFAIKCV